MKIAILNDTHFGARNDNAVIAEHQRKFYDEVFFPYLKEMYLEEKMTELIEIWLQQL